MSAREWAQVPPEIRDESFWSAKLEHARHVADLKRASLQALRGARIQVNRLNAGITDAPGSADRTLLMSKDLIMREMRKAALDRGLAPTGPRDMEDFASATRIGLIVDMAEKMTYNRAKWEGGNDPTVLDSWPAQELVRVEPRKEPRDWDARWQEAGEAVAWEGAVKDGPMIAMKSSPIWTELSEFGLPYPPFDYGSGMGVRDVERATAIEYGLMKDDDEVAAADAPDEVRGSLNGLDDTERQWLAQQLQDRLGDGVSIDGDEVVFKRKG